MSTVPPQCTKRNVLADIDAAGRAASSRELKQGLRYLYWLVNNDTLPPITAARCLRLMVERGASVQQAEKETTQ